MSRLYDRIVSRGATPKGHLSRTIASNSETALSVATVISVGEVANYWAANLAREELLGASDLPNVAPPLEIAFVEYPWPNAYLPDSHHMSAAAYGRIGHRMKSVGVLLEYHDLTEGTRADMFREAEYLGGLMDKVGNDARWLLSVMPYAQMAGDPKPVGPLSTHMFGVRPDGRICEHGRTLPVTSIMFDETTAGGSFEGNREAREGQHHQLMTMIDPAFLAVCFAHCKNVEMLANDPPAKLSRKHERKHGKPLKRYYTLDIDPAKRILKTEGKIEATGLKHALHICRGHFKTFTPEKPLFGKRVGTYWWPQQVRGSKDRGEVVKDYAIRRPN